MSLDTVLKIGKVLRNSSNSLKHFKYVQPCPKDKKGNYPLCLSFKVNDDFSIDFNSVSIISENQRDKLYYLTFKTSDSDGLVKYIYGDIYYEHSCKIDKKDNSLIVSEGGYYRLANPNHSNKAFQSSSFNRGNADFNSISGKSERLSKIREGIKNNLADIESILKYSSAIEYYFEEKNGTPFKNYITDTELLYNNSIVNNFNKSNKQTLAKLNIKEMPKNDDISARNNLFKLTDCKIFIHFDYSGKHWYELKDCFDAVSAKMTEEFVEESENGDMVLKKSLYKNLCSGDTKNDIQFPNFSLKGKKKSKSFTDEEIASLFYAASYTSKGKSIYKTDIKLIVLPLGDNLTEKDYADFLDKNNEISIVNSNEYSNSLFDFADTGNKDITVFDLILCKKGGMTSPDSDLVEISGVEKSKLRNIKERISKIAHSIYNERKKEIGTEKELYPFAIEYSFLNILGNPQYEEKTKKMKFVENSKYQSHLIKVLPLIYTDNYIHDDVLLPSFIRNVESSIRSGDTKYKFLKYDLKFLLSIQNNQINKYMQITQSESYGIGLLLGSLAKNLSLEINSFEKNYVGNLTRRISTMDDFIKLKNDIEQKLIMHDKSKYTFKTSYELAQKVKEFKSGYDKEECAFGFFESYFKPVDKQENQTNNL